VTQARTAAPALVHVSGERLEQELTALLGLPGRIEPARPRGAVDG